MENDKEIQPYPVQGILFEYNTTEPFAIGPPMLTTIRGLLHKWGKDDEGQKFYRQNFDHAKGSIILRQKIPAEIRDSPDATSVLTAKVAIVLSSYATHVNRPWVEPIIVDADDIATSIGLDKRHYLNRLQKLNIVMECMDTVNNLVIAVETWDADYGKTTRAKPFVEIKEVYLLEPQARLFDPDPTKPHKDVNELSDGDHLLYVLQFGAWSEAFLNFAGTRQVGYIHQSALDENPYHQKFAAILKLYLAQVCAIQKGDVKRKVGTLWEYVAGSTEELDRIANDRRLRSDWVAAWDEALLKLHEDKWNVTFDDDHYPLDLRPAGFEGPANKPRGYWDRLKSAIIYVSPPEPIYTPTGDLIKRRKRRVKRTLPTISGPRIRAARENLGWSQQELAEASGVDRSLISRIERGERLPTKEVELAIRQKLGI